MFEKWCMYNVKLYVCCNVQSHFHKHMNTFYQKLTFAIKKPIFSINKSIISIRSWHFHQKYWFSLHNIDILDQNVNIMQEKSELNFRDTSKSFIKLILIFTEEKCLRVTHWRRILRRVLQGNSLRAITKRVLKESP